MKFERDPDIDTARTATFSQCSTERSQEATPRAPLAVDSSDFLAVANAHEKTSMEALELLASTAQGRRAQRQGRRAARLQKPDHMDTFMHRSSEAYTDKEMLKEQQELVRRMCRRQDEEIVEKARVKAEEKIKEEQLQMMRFEQEQLQQMKVLQLLEPPNVTSSSSPSQAHVSYILRHLKSAASEDLRAPSTRRGLTSAAAHPPSGGKEETNQRKVSSKPTNHGTRLECSSSEWMQASSDNKI